MCESTGQLPWSQLASLLYLQPVTGQEGHSVVGWELLVDLGWFWDTWGVSAPSISSPGKEDAGWPRHDLIVITKEQERQVEMCEAC